MLKKLLNTHVLFACFALCGFFNTSYAQTTLTDTISVSGTTGSYATGSVNSSGTKNDNLMTGISSTGYRGWAIFKLGTIPSNAVITSANVLFTTSPNTVSSTGSNNLYGFGVTPTNHPSTVAGATLYTSLNTGTTLSAGSWTANALNNRTLNATGVSFVSSHIGDSILISFVRGSGNIYEIYGYGATASQKPKLIVSYYIPTPCSGTPTAGATIATNDSVCAGTSATLSLQNSFTGQTGITIQWQSSPNNITWTNVGTNAATYTVTPTSTAYYRAYVVCNNSNTSDTSIPKQVVLKSFLKCYCNSAALYTGDEDIFNVTVFTGSNTSTCSSTGGAGSAQNLYSNYSSITIDSISQQQIVNFSVQIGTCGGNYNNAIAIYIDYNQNGSYADAGEMVYKSSTYTYGPHTESGTFTVPASAMLGITGLRVVNVETSSVSSIAACGTYGYGETEDYRIKILPYTGCSGAPNIGNTVASVDSICSGSSISLSLSTTPTAGGIHYQWQSSPNGTTWTNMTDTLPTATAIVTAATYYRCIATCTATSASDTSTPKLITLRNFLNCYCTSAANSTGDEDIFNVTIFTGSNTSTCSSTGGAGSAQSLYSNYSSITIDSISQQQIVNFSVQIGTCGGNYNNGLAIFIDYNQNGSYADAGEMVYQSSTYTYGPHTESGTFTVPASAMLGITGLRVVNVETTSVSSIAACGTYGYGETEDYRIKILPYTGCSGTPNIGNTVASVDSTCSGSSISLSLSTTPTAGGIHYQWQSSPNGTTWTNMTDTLPTATAIVTAATYYRCIATCTATSASDTSTPKLVTLRSFLNCYCTSAAQYTGDEDIFNVTIASGSNTSTCSSTGGAGSAQSLYSNYSSITIDSISQQQIVNFSVQIGTCGGNYNNGLAIFIDYNQNGSYTDAGEMVYQSSTYTYGPHTETGTFYVPTSALPGITGLRVVNVETSSVSSIAACGIYGYGETEDYRIKILPFVGCSGTPNIGNTISSADSACTGSSVGLSLSSTPSTGGIYYQWQSSTNGTVWTNMTDTLPTATAIVTAATYYRCIATCTATSASDTSTPKQVTVKSFLNCYCAASASCDETIDSFKINTINNASGCSGGYASYTSIATDLAQGMGYPTSLYTANYYSGDQAYVWIDYNHDGVFSDATERTTLTYAGSGLLFNDTVTVPMTAMTGVTMMRARIMYTTYYGACGVANYGETEDYLVNITTSPLAIELSDISARNEGSSNSINWITANELSSDYFILERSADGKNFVEIATIKTNGKPSSYQYIDEQPIKGVNYYRLKLMEVSGRSKYTKVVAATVIGSGNFTVEAYPNPVSSMLNIAVYGTIDDNAQVEVMDVTGKVIRQLKVTDATFNMNMNDLAAGVYMIKYTDNSHQKTIRVNKQ